MQPGTEYENTSLCIKVMSIARTFCVQNLYTKNHQVYLRINGLIFIISTIEMFLFLERLFSRKGVSPVPAFYVLCFHWYSFNRVVSHLRCSKNMMMGGSRILSLEGWWLGAYPGPESMVAMVMLLLCQGCFSLWVERSSPASNYVGFWQLERMLKWCAASPDGSSESLHLNPIGNSGPAEERGN